MGEEGYSRLRRNGVACGGGEMHGAWRRGNGVARGGGEW